MYKKIIFTAGIFVVAVAQGFSQTPAARPAAALDAVYEGMPEDELHKYFPTSDQKEYYEVGGDKKYIVFHDRSTKDPTDGVLFYLVNEKVQAWTKYKIPEIETPEQRLEKLKERQSYSQGAQEAGGASETAEVLLKRMFRMDRHRRTQPQEFQKFNY